MEGHNSDNESRQAESAAEREARLVREGMKGRRIDSVIFEALKGVTEISQQERVDLVLKEIRDRATKGFSDDEREEIEFSVQKWRTHIDGVLKNNPNAPFKEHRAMFEKFLDEVLEISKSGT